MVGEQNMNTVWSTGEWHWQGKTEVLGEKLVFFISDIFLVVFIRLDQGFYRCYLLLSTLKSLFIPLVIADMCVFQL
jgi:hypothetical protein